MGTRDAEEQLEVAKAEMVRLETENAHLKAGIAQWERNYPCDGGCNYNDGPAEECSRHGRPPRDIWEAMGVRTKAWEKSEAVIAEVKRLAELDVRCPCCTGYENILDTLATYQNGADQT